MITLIANIHYERRQLVKDAGYSFDHEKKRWKKRVYESELPWEIQQANEAGFDFWVLEWRHKGRNQGYHAYLPPIREDVAEEVGFRFDKNEKKLYKSVFEAFRGKCADHSVKYDYMLVQTYER